MKTLFYGRAVTEEEVKGEGVNFSEIAGIESLPALSDSNAVIRCMRCGNDQRSEFSEIPCSCGEDCIYCLSCLQMGQLRVCTKLWYLREKNDFPSLKEPILTWKGRLSQQQAEASKDIIYSIKK